MYGKRQEVLITVSNVFPTDSESLPSPLFANKIPVSIPVQFRNFPWPESILIITALLIAIETRQLSVTPIRLATAPAVNETGESLCSRCKLKAQAGLKYSQILKIPLVWPLLS